MMPGIAGGASWAGAAFDPETGILYVSSITMPYAATMAKSPVPHADYAGELLRWRRCRACPSGNRPTGVSPPSI